MRRTGLTTAAVAVGLAVTMSAGLTASGQEAGELTMSANRTEIHLGETVTFQTDFSSGPEARQGARVELWRQPYQGAWEMADAEDTNFFGSAGLSDHPRKRTVYQWRFPGDEQTAYTESATVVVRVHARVTIAVKDTTLRPGQRLVVTGKTVPPKPGITVTLRRVTIGGVDEKWFSGTVRSDGTYRLTRIVHRVGRWRLYVRIPAAAGNLDATSGYIWIDVD